MVHLQKVTQGAETYYYLVHNYRNKFGRPWRRPLAKLGKILPPKDVLQRKIMEAEGKRLTADFYETLFEQLWEKHGERGKAQFIAQLRHGFGLGKVIAEKQWNDIRKLYLRLTGTTPQPELLNNSPPQLQPQPLNLRHFLSLPKEGKKLNITLKAPLGVCRTLKQISRAYWTQTDGLRAALNWLATKLTDNVYEVLRDGYPKQYYRLQTKDTKKVIAKCTYVIPPKSILHAMSFYLHRNDVQWLNYIIDRLEVYSRTPALHLTILLYGSTQGIALPLFCEYEHRSSETKYRKTYQMVSCRSSFLRGRKVKPAFCLTCPDFR